ncbi:MAG: hypothetical protein JST54_09705 [Deltaproteobacteria bacterium]|nr:hypothetical protein [Deltaproteobacteria bacterium]
MNRVAILTALAALLLAGCGSKCDSSSCGGCCDASGVCQSDSAAHCGLNGAACTACTGLQACVLGSCQLPGNTNAGSGNGPTTSGASSGGSTGASTGNASGSTGASTHGASSGSTSATTSTDTTGSTGSTASSTTTSNTTGSTASTTGSSSSSSGTTTAASTDSGSSTGTSTTTTTGSTGTSTTTTTTGTSSSSTTSTSTTTGTTGTSTTGTTGTTGGCSGFTPLARLTGPGTSQEVFGNTEGDPTFTSALCTDPFLGTGAGGPTANFTFSVNQPVILNASVGSLDGGSVNLSLTQGCGASEVEDECADGFLVGGILGPDKLSPGVYNLRVTGTTEFLVGGAGSGEYDLNVSLSQPVANDDCSGVIFLSLSGGTAGNASVTVDTSGAQNDTVTSPTGACSFDDGTGTGNTIGHGNGPDVVYGVHLPNGAPNGIHATLTPVNGSTAAPVLSVRSAPCINNFDDAGATSAQELGCGYSLDGGVDPVSIATLPLPAGDYFIWVDSLGGTMGSMRLDVNVL